MRGKFCRAWTAVGASLAAWPHQPFQRRGLNLLRFAAEPREIFGGIRRLVLCLRQRQAFGRFPCDPGPARRAEGEQGG